MNNACAPRRLCRCERALFGDAARHAHPGRAERRLDMGEKAIINIRTVRDGHNPPGRVHASMLWAERRVFTI